MMTYPVLIHKEAYLDGEMEYVPHVGIVQSAVKSAQEKGNLILSQTDRQTDVSHKGKRQSCPYA
jgi:hypothetical protein